MSPVVAVLDYGFGNVRSAVRALEHVGAKALLSSDYDTCLNADGLIIPGVGAFDACMKGINQVRGGPLVDARLVANRPVLGICVGMQILFDQGIEHGVSAKGLGQWPGVVTPLEAPVVPHMGWNTVTPPNESVLFAGVETESFYFVHSYAVHDWVMTDTDPFQNPPLITWSEYGTPFVAAVENGPLSAVQFHPEKSDMAGLALINNWIQALA
ncbi:MAG: imidazole glycerol phosphate synthase subunit HisH [Candidatus Nanopelagicales bacterium]|jgi:imidazole glycerol-phosphate synthase subunit HisH|nr:imidazole glycerol phosphate synthase subunit HisH [Actinomycetes bacterium]MCH9831072.1 imidazole glycerol phosphate synthase subunit HisH [Actinomycetes bacterium]MCH9841020.1 imidazole glycerol phosphate synthase subunit HisH [Actinomycetes bacterium]